MGQIIKTEPAYCTKPGTAVTENGVIVSAVFRGQEPCGLILYNKKDEREFTVPFTDEHRFGSLYSVRISLGKLYEARKPVFRRTHPFIHLSISNRLYQFVFCHYTNALMRLKATSSSG